MIEKTRPQEQGLESLSSAKQLSDSIESSDLGPARAFLLLHQLRLVVKEAINRIWNAEQVSNLWRAKYEELHQDHQKIVTYFEGLVETLRAKMRFDSKTGCFSNDYFQEEVFLPFLRRVVRNPDRRTKWLALWVIDIGNFKATNDRLGHAYGDKILGRFGRLMRLSVKFKDRIDYPVRVGGDEFVVLMTEVNEVLTAHDVATRFKSRVMSRRWKGIHKEMEKDLLPRPDIGIACLRSATLVAPVDAETLARLWTHEADQLMYRSKKEGEIFLKCFGWDSVQEKLIPTEPEAYKLAIETERRHQHLP